MHPVAADPSAKGLAQAARLCIVARRAGVVRRDLPFERVVLVSTRPMAKLDRIDRPRPVQTAQVVDRLRAVRTLPRVREPVVSESSSAESARGISPKVRFSQV